jgi:ribosomal protein S18 acetylase RimI-like enzyme
MTNRNKTLNIEYRFLTGEDFGALYQANLAAFSDYLVPLQMTKNQFKNHFAQNAIDINLSVGAFSNSKLVGFTLNGFGLWNGKQTAYDAGTGVIPEYRKNGIGKGVFNFLLPVLKEKGIEQMLLEVISNNQKAINLYRNLGFETSRKLQLFRQTEPIVANPAEQIKIKQIEKNPGSKLNEFADKQTSWQFSNEAVERKLSSKSFVEAYSGDKCVGYGVLFPKSGIVAQLAVDRNYRRQNIATNLLAEMEKMTIEGKKLRFGNVDSDLDSLIKLAEKLKFEPTISQYEMILELQ